MTANEFDTFVSKYGKDILRYCRMITGNFLEGDDLYQDTMLTLLEQQEKLDFNQNMKSYALSVSNFIWKNRKRKFAWRKRIAPSDSYELHIQGGNDFSDTEESVGNPKNSVLQNEKIQIVRNMVAALPEKGKEIPVFISTDDEAKWGSSWSSCEPDDSGGKTYEIAYCHGISLICEGDNIDTITYSINTGYFLVQQREGVNVIVAGKKADTNSACYVQ